MSWRAAGSNGNVFVFHLVATKISPAFSSWSDPRAEAEIRDDLTATAVPHLRREAVRGRAEMGSWSTLLQDTAQDPPCLLFPNMFKPEEQKFKGLIVYFSLGFQRKKPNLNQKCGTHPVSN